MPILVKELLVNGLRRGAGADDGAAVLLEVESLAGGVCCVACLNSAIFWSNDCACSAMAAGACVGATGAGFFNTKTMATKAATKVAMLMMRSSLSFMATPDRSAQDRQAHSDGRGCRGKDQVTKVLAR